LPDLSSDARALLEAGKAAEPLPPGVAAHVWGKLAATVAIAPAAPPPASTSLHLAPAATFKTFALAKLVAVSVGILGTGSVATVAVVHLRARPPSPAIGPPPQEAAPAPTVPPIPATLPAVPDKPPAATRAAPALPAHSSPKSVLASRSPEAPGGDLAAERSLIARARSSLESGLPLDALATLKVHEQRFERGALAQQREALRIQALIASGNRPAAEAAAARFERDYPQSLMGPAVRAALSAKP
jgi:hypothetical protein